MFWRQISIKNLETGREFQCQHQRQCFAFPASPFLKVERSLLSSPLSLIEFAKTKSPQAALIKVELSLPFGVLDDVVVLLLHNN
jgi:hypothetical protein